MDNILFYEFEWLSQAEERAHQLERDREMFHEDLYNAITFPSTWLDYTAERPYSTATDIQAIKIVETKERYEKEIQKEYERYELWLKILSWLEDSDRQALVNYLQHNERCDVYKIKRILRRVSKRYEKELLEIEKALDKEALEQLRVLPKEIPRFKEYENKRIYLIKGEERMLTEEEFEQMWSVVYGESIEERLALPL